MREVADLPESAAGALTFLPVATLEEVLAAAFPEGEELGEEQAEAQACGQLSKL